MLLENNAFTCYLYYLQNVDPSWRIVAVKRNEYIQLENLIDIQSAIVNPVDRFVRYSIHKE